MLVMLACAALVALGVLIVVREREWAAAEWPTVVRYAALVIVPGVIATGAGGRLVMRALAVTSSSNVDGSFTEAGATIGEITVEGTLGFLTFTGLPAGFLAAVLFVLVAAHLPRGRAGGAVLGLLLLVLVGAWLEPLRPDNIDFNLVGPGWLSLLLFAALAAFQGVVTWAVATGLRIPALRVVPRVLLYVALLIALPAFVLAVGDIVA